MTARIVTEPDAAGASQVDQPAVSVDVARAAKPPPRPARHGGRDLTQGAILPLLIAFSAPTLVSNMLQSLNGSINSVWVGRFLGDQALAATANANVIMFLMFGAVFGFGMAATVLIGQAMGRRDVEAARRAMGAVLGFSIMLAVAVAIVGFLASSVILRALGTPQQSFALAHAYLRVTFAAMPFTLVSVMLMMGLRGTGDAVTPLRFMLVGVAIDLVMNPVLILGMGPFPRLGITGSALSTALAGFVSLTGMIAYIYARDLTLRLRGAELAYLVPRWGELRFILTRGLPMGAQMLLVSSAGLVMMRLVNQEGLLTTAAFGATLQLWTYVQMPALAIGAAVSAMAAQNIGANQWDRVEQANWTGVALNVALTGGLVAVLLLFDRAALVLFLGSHSPAVDVGRHIQLLASWSFILFGATIVLFGTMRANGAVIVPLLILAASLYPARLGFYAAFHATMGADAIWWAFPVGSAVSLTLGLIAYRWGFWRRLRPV